MTTPSDPGPLDWSTQRVLVTGAGGVLGTALLAALDGLRPAALVFPTRTDCDLLRQEDVFAMMARTRPSLVFHLAGRVAGVAGNLAHAGAAYYENTLINLNVIEGARLAGATRIVAAGTTAIYPDSVPLPMRESDIGRGVPHNSEAAYAQAKLGMLAQLEAYKLQYGLSFAYLVCTNLFGPNDRFDERYGHVVPSLISRFHRATEQAEPSIVIWGDGTPTRDFLHSSDAAGAFVRCAEAAEGVLNVATGEAVPIRKLVENLTAISGFRGNIVWDTDRPLGQLTRSYNTDRIRATGWAPRLTLRDGLADTYRWFSAAKGAVRR